MAPDATGRTPPAWPVPPSDGVPQRNRKDVVVERVMGLIRSGGLGSADRLPPEGELATSFGVSRTVIREAMKALEAVGVVRIEQGRGTFVAANPLARTFSLWATMNLHRLDELYEVRKIVEAETVSRATLLSTPNDVAAIRAALEAHHRALRGSDWQAVVDADCAFHRGIARVCGLGLLAEMLEVTVPVWTSVSPSQNFERAALAAHEHERIVAAIAAHDADGARHAMIEHIDGAYRRLRAATAATKEGDVLPRP
jgi:GntR family transcriptional regulator, transcriptional repressor for pyruvate dehydrogenase complex